MKRSVAILLSVIMVLILVLPNTTAFAVAKVDTSKPVALKMILLGSKPVDCDLVYAKVNEKTKALINATVTPTFYDWGDWNTKYNLAFVSGESFDLIYTSSWANYQDQSLKSGFLPLTLDMIKTYAPKTYANVTTDDWTQTKIKGKIYMVPYTSKEFSHMTVMIRGDLRQKYKLPPVKTKSDLLKYMDAVAKNEKSILPFNGGVGDTEFISKLFYKDVNGYLDIQFGSITMPVKIDTKDKTHLKIVDTLTDPLALDFYMKLKDYKKKGYWSQNQLVNKTVNEVAFDNGASAVYIRAPLNISQAYSKDNLAHPDWKLEIVDVNPDAHSLANPALSNGMAIHSTSENPERALMLLDLLRNNKEINDLTTLGIPNKHWKPVGENKFTALPEGKNFSQDSACPWGWRTSLYRQDAQTPKAILDVMAHQNRVAFTHPLQLFNFDDSKLKSEVAQVGAVANLYQPILNGGFATNITATLKEYADKLNKAGYQKVLDEYKAQANAFLDSYYK